MRVAGSKLYALPQLTLVLQGACQVNTLTEVYDSCCILHLNTMTAHHLNYQHRSVLKEAVVSAHLHRQPAHS